MSLSKLDMLIIRACKSKDPIKRLRSVYRRFWFAGSDMQMYRCFIPHLVRFCMEYSNTQPLKLLEMSKPCWYIGIDERSWEETTFVNLVTEVRLTHRGNFPEEML